MDELDPTNLRDLATLIGAPRQLPQPSVPFVVLAQDQKIESLERLLQSPPRIKELVRFRSGEDWVRFVSQRKGPETVVFRSQHHFGRGCLLACIDYHSTVPSWCDFKVSLDLNFTEDFEAWKAANDKWMLQKNFAEFIEDRGHVIVVPDAASFLEIAQDLQYTLDARCQTVTRLNNGAVRVNYQEEIKTSGGNSCLELPTRFEINLPVCDRTVAAGFGCRLKTRIHDKQLQLKFQIEHLNEALRNQFDELCSGYEKSLGMRFFDAERSAS